MFCPSYYIRQV